MTIRNKQWELFLGLVLLLMLFVFTVTAHAQGQTGSPYNVPPTYPDPQSQAQQMPPDSGAPAPQQISTEQAETQIENHLKSEPALHDADLRADVSDDSIVLTGAINTEQQRDVALRIARSYAGGRSVVDKMVIEKWRDDSN